MNQTSRHANRRLFWAICTFVICFWLGTGSFAQESVSAEISNFEEDLDVDLDLDLLIGGQLGLDYAAWNDTAERAEGLLLRDVASVFALDRMRTSLSEWREIFAAEMDDNAARLETLNAQLVALGEAPVEDETEAAMVTLRRDALIAQRDDVAAPGLIAAEALARAAGMISEIEAQIRERQTEAYLERGVSPLNILHWPDAVTYVWQGIHAIGAETVASLTAKRWTSDSFGQILWAVIFLVFAGMFFVRGRTWARQLEATDPYGAQFVVREFFGTVLQAVFPLIGLTSLVYGLSLLDIFGVRGEAILRTVPLTGSIIILAAWLGRQFFPEGDKYGPLNQPHVVRGKARRVSIALAWIAALWLPYIAFLSSGLENETAVALLNFPFILVLSVTLFRFATLLRHGPDPDAGEDAGLGRNRALIGRATQVVALIAPLAGAAGYYAAAQAVLFPTILTLGLLGVGIYFQTVSSRVCDLLYGVDANRAHAFLPVVIGFVLSLISVPLIALIWGAQTADLLSYWTRFTEGVTLGDVQVSPSDFIAFIFIFCFGYFITGFVKNALRTSILPRTSLDLGAQDAIVAGFGYVGIFLAAVIAITSAGIDLSNLAIVAGALSVGIGFGLQTIVSNFVSGIILLIERPVSQGDWIEVGDRMGYVRDISVRATRIETFDRSDVIVPNADLISNQVINWTRGNLAGRLILPIGVAYGTDVDRVAAILKEIAEAHPMVVMSPPPSILFMNFGADAIEFEIRAILRDVNFKLSVQSELNFQISRRFAAEDIEIPFAQRDIWLRNPEVLGQAETNKDTPKPTAAPFQQVPQPDQANPEPDGGDIE